MNVDFGGFAGRILDDEEHFGDELDDVARLQNQVTFPLAAKRRRQRRRLGLEMQAARLKIANTRRRCVFKLRK